MGSLFIQTRLFNTAIIVIIANVLFTGGHFFIPTSYLTALVGALIDFWNRPLLTAVLGVKLQQ